MPKNPFPTKITHRFIAVSFPFLLFFFAELTARLFLPYTPSKPQELSGWSSGIRPAAGYIEPPLLIEKNDIVYPNKALMPFVRPFSFRKKRTKKRIFCLGGSATLGVPFEETPQKTFPLQLQKALSKAGEETEIINLGGASFGSDHVLALGTEALRYDPDYLVIYSGNNEFFNHIINLEQQNKKWEYQSPITFHILAHIQHMLFSTPSISKRQEKQQERWVQLLQSFINKSTYVNTKKNIRIDPIQEAVVKRYLYNLKTLNIRAQERNVPIVIAIVPSNLNTPPSISIHSPQNNNRDQWILQLENVDTIRFPECQTALEQLTILDPWYALGWYKRAKCAEIHNQPTAKFRKAARDLDMLPGRPNAALNEALLNTDLPLLLFEAEPDFFHDSCHLTARGYEELGRKFSQIILTNWNFLHIDPKQNP